MMAGQQCKLVGIVNVTPDSFSDGGKFFDPAKAIAQAHQLFADGAVIVDIGAEATNPKAKPITVDEEWQRLEPILSVVLPRYPDFQISLDTHHPEIVRKASALGDFIINDVTTFQNPDMIAAAVETGFPCIVSHLPFWVKGDIQLAHSTEDKLVNSVEQVKHELLKRHDEMIAAGVKPEKIILDPGVGFGKSPETNRQLVRFAEKVPGIPVLIGYSRKRFLGEDQRYTAQANLEQGRIAIQSGARYLRVHDVKAHRRLLRSA